MFQLPPNSASPPQLWNSPNGQAMGVLQGQPQNGVSPQTVQQGQFSQPNGWMTGPSPFGNAPQNGVAPQTVQQGQFGNQMPSPQLAALSNAIKANPGANYLQQQGTGTPQPGPMVRGNNMPDLLRPAQALNTNPRPNVMAGYN